jgi:Cu2+-containing amine oxidase
MSFVDLTGKIVDRKAHLKETQCADNEQTKSRLAIKPSGKKSIVGNKVQYKIVSQNTNKFIYAKPAFVNRVTNQH